MSSLLRPRAVTQRPSFAVPADACDCHAHIFGDPKRFPFIEERSYTPPQGAEDEYLRMLAQLGVQRMVIVQPSVYGFDNSCTLAAVKAFGLHRARAVAMFDARATDAELRALHEAGVRGVRFITLAKGGAPLGQLRSVASRIADFGWHIQMYLTPEQWRDLSTTILDLPVPVVMDHMAQLSPDRTAGDPAHDAVLRLLDSGRAWIKLIAYRVSRAGPPYHDVQPLAQRFLRHAPERCLWGSDWPHPNHTHVPEDAALVEALERIAPTESLRRQLLVTNPADFYRFEA